MRNPNLWTAEQVDKILVRVAAQEVFRTPVLSGYLNPDAESREFLEQRLTSLRRELDCHQRPFLDECAGVARGLFRKHKQKGRSFAFFIRGGQRAFLYCVPLALATHNQISAGVIPALYQLNEIRDNLDQFAILHLQADRVQFTRMELGGAVQTIGFRGAYGTRSWWQALAECFHRLDSMPETWIVAAPPELLADASRLCRNAKGLLPVQTGADEVEVRQQATALFQEREEMDSRALAARLLSGETYRGPIEVLNALQMQSPANLVIQSKRHDMGIAEIFDSQESAVWLAQRAGVHVEIVNQHDGVAKAGGLVCG